LPGGYKHSNGAYYEIKTVGAYWTSSGYINASYAWMRYHSFNTEMAFRTYYGKTFRLSVRCLKD